MSDSPEVLKLIQEGAKAFSEKNFEAAVDKYSEACQVSNLITGQDDPDLLFLYGKSLFENGVSKNEVLGGDGPQGDEDEDDDDEEVESGDQDKSNAKKSGQSMFQFSENAPLAEAEDEDDEEEDGEEEAPQEEEEEEEEGKDAEAEGEEEQTDFEVAWEILDLTRTIYEEQLTELEQKYSSEGKTLSKPYLKDDNSKQEESAIDPLIKLNKKLSQVYDLLSELSLETENFERASQDLETLITILSSLYPSHSRLISEAYFKLSLAFEFLQNNKEESKEIPEGDKELLNKSIEAMKKSLDSIKERSKFEEIDEDLLVDMETRYKELSKDPLEKIKEEKEKIMKGIMGQLVESVEKEDTKASEETTTGGFDAPKTSQVNDLTQMVKKRKNPSAKMVSKKPKTQ